MGNYHFFRIIFRILLLVFNGIFIYLAFTSNYIINGIGFAFLFLFQLFLLYEYNKKLFIDVEKSIDCLLHNDYSNTFSKKKRENPLHNKTALLLEKHRKKNLLQISESLVLTNIIESLNIGILILRKDKNGNITVFQINKAFTNFVKIPKYHNWNLLKDKIGGLLEFINQWKQLRLTIALSINEEEESFFINTSVTETNEYEYLIVSLETIQQLIDKKEKEAWYKLMNVMSHEIINTITPISSLADNLESLLQENETDQETINELSEGLKIIKRRSYHLNSFVDTYRKLAELPLPQKNRINLTETIRNTLLLFEQEFTTNNIEIIFENNVVYINADKQQVEQVLINLISNCLYALAETAKPIIKVELRQENNRTHIEITDNGIGISSKIKDNIFVPYFTTRKNGSGIGLTLTKSIIEAHKGIINFKSIKGKTTFFITFIT